MAKCAVCGEAVSLFASGLTVYNGNNQYMLCKNCESQYELLKKYSSSEAVEYFEHYSKDMDPGLKEVMDKSVNKAKSEGEDTYKLKATGNDSGLEREVKQIKDDVHFIKTVVLIYVIITLAGLGIGLISVLSAMSHMSSYMGF